MFDKIPQELRDTPNWCVWRYEETDGEKPTKVPYNARTDKLASSTNKATWSTFEVARTAHATLVNGMGYSGLGFFFGDDDAFAGIDLDPTDEDVAAGKMTADEAAIIHERQQKVYTEFDSYSERSPSGKGLHIIVKGRLRSGRRRSKIEMYSTGRFFTMTGDVYRDAPIAERQHMLDILWEQMGNGTKIYNYDKDYNGPELHSDKDIIGKALAAQNGDVFNLLHTGKWADKYASQSEADLAYINILAFYTQNRQQITRIFHTSPLGIRDKAHVAGYVDRNINKSFDRMLPPIDLDAIVNGVRDAVEQKRVADGSASQGRADLAPTQPASPEVRSYVNGDQPQTAPGAKHVAQPITAFKSFPPGLVGEVAHFIYSQAPRPVEAIALAGAIGLLSGICGKGFNVSSTGLNQYVLLLAPTGTGKEAIARGIDKLIAATTPAVPNIIDFIGPGEIASPQALAKYMSKRSQCFVTVSGEVGLLLEQMSSKTANPNMIGLKRTLLDLYNKSGFGSTVKPTIYSDTDKNTDTIEAPAFSWIGESTPERFYGVLNEAMISEGLLPRFTIIEYHGDRPALNEGHGSVVPPWGLVDKLGSLAARCLEMQATKKVTDVPSDSAADKLFKEFDVYADSQINCAGSEVVRHLWNRAHIKSLKLAALVAIGINHMQPVITYNDAYWAIDLITQDVRNMMKRFEAGDVGEQTNDGRQQEDMRKMIGKYLVKTDSKMIDPKMQKDGVIPYSYISRVCMNIVSFKGAKNGATNAIKTAVQAMIDSGYLQEVGSEQKAQNYKITSARVFAVVNAAHYLNV